MKKANVFMALVIVCCLVSFSKQSFAEKSKQSQASTSLNKVGAHSFLGTIDSINESTLVVINKNNKKHTFTLSPKSKILDMGDKPSVISQLKKGEKVQVKYSEAKGAEEVLSVHLK